MRHFLLSVLVGVLVFLGLGASARADAVTCTHPPDSEPGINFGFWCEQSWINFYWAGYDFDKSDWDDGFGYESACDLSMPLARTFNAIEVLNYAMPDDPVYTNDFNGNILRWGGNYTLREIDELDGRCGDGTERAKTVYGPIVDNYTELYMTFFYDENVVERAGTLIHEARHAEWCAHSGNDGDNPCPARSASCDESFDDGCSGVGSPSGRGADGFQAVWLWWYTYEADALHGTTALKDMARDEANRIFDTMFDVPPCFNITDTGATFGTCG